MASLKDLKNRIKSVKSTQKITKAMKMVAAAKLRRAQERAEASRPYSEKMGEVISTLTASIQLDTANPNLLAGTGRDEKYLLIVATSNRGLCGAFNSSIARAAVVRVNRLVAEGKQVKILCIGRKGFDMLRRAHRNKIIDVVEINVKNQIPYGEAEAIAKRVIELFNAGEFDVASIFYNKFQSAIAQVVTEKRLIPLELPANENTPTFNSSPASGGGAGGGMPFEFEPDEEEILDVLLPKNIAIQVYSSLLENMASEQGARMTAMDNATRNAGDMISGLTLVYNRTRQAAITKELIEIISGAEAI